MDSDRTPPQDSPVRDLLPSTSSATVYADDLFRGFVEHAPYALLVTDDAGRIAFANSRVEGVFGYRPAQLIGRSVEDLVPADRRARHAVLRQDMDRGPGHSRDMGTGREVVALHADGHEFPVEIGLSSVETAAGPMVLAAVVDVTARRAAEQALAESEERFRELAEHVRDVFWMIEWPSERVLYVNRAFSTTWGWPREALYQRPGLWLDAVHPDDRDGVLARFAGEAAAGTFDCEYRVVARDGSVRHVRDRRFAVRDDTGEVSRIAGIAEDVTNRRHAEALLRRERERAEIALASIAEGVITTDAAGRVESLNAVAEQMLGCSAAEARGRDIASVVQAVHETTREPLSSPTHAALRDRRASGFSAPALLVRRDGTELHIETSAAPLLDAGRQLMGSIVVLRDVTAQRQVAREVSWHATHDGLTGLVNRREFDRRLDLMLAHLDAQRPMALCYVDLDHFKVVNDTCGHAAGDGLLRQLAALIRGRLRDRDTAARLGGDEFALLLGECPAEHAVRIAEDLRNRIVEFSFTWEGRSFRVGASVGVVPLTTKPPDVAAVLAAADAACYAAKQAGGNRVHLLQFTGPAGDRRDERSSVLLRVQRALAGDGFRLYGQPIVPLAGAGVPGGHVEVLLRLATDGGDPLVPNVFMPTAERYRQMRAIDRWVVSTVLAHLEAANGQGPGLFSINLSGQSITDEGFLAFLTALLRDSEVPPARLCFELTERTAVAHPTAAERVMGTLRDAGCSVALDDFGSSVSSFAHLRGLPVDYVKIEGRLVRSLAEDAIDHATVEAIHRIARMLRIRTVAESVDGEGVLQRLREIGIDYAQGFGLARPAPLQLVTP
jgi:diguanylate cyclase (GGDEF)-like protein/PAS domain S-box-containing protein